MVRCWFWFFVAVVCVVGSACKKATDVGDRKAVLPQTSMQLSNASKTDAVVAADSVAAFPQSIPGLARDAHDVTLDAEVANVDPNVDGWTSEAFNDQALAQLKKLAKWIEGANGPLPKVFADSLVFSKLRPTSLATVYDESGIRVQSWRQGEQELAAATREHLKLPEVEEELRKLLPVNEDVHAELKIIGIDVPENPAGETVTRVRCHLAGANANSRYQQNAAWKVTWQDAADTNSEPMISAIELAEFEEIRAAGNQLFADQTSAVFRGEPCFQQQLNRSLDYWRDRLDWRFGWLVVGAHGLAVGDANGDGLEDVYVADTGGVPNRLLLQQPDGTVRDAAAEMGVNVVEPTQAALFVDLDNDGDQDLLASVARFVLIFENDGNGRFVPHPIQQSTSMLRSLAAIDYDNDGLLDVYACGYSLRNPGDAVGLGRPLPYHDANNGAPSFLLRNTGGFRFANVTSEVGLDANNSRFSYAAAWEDFDNDGDPDLYVANDFGRNNLYRNDGGRFTDIAAEAGVEDIAAGMSVSWGDYNRDGLPDIYVGNMFSSAGNRIAYQRQFRHDIDEETLAMYQRHARGNSLFQNLGDGTFRDVSQETGVTEARWAWSSNFADINNDGWQDVLIGNGMVTGTDDSGDL